MWHYVYWNHRIISVSRLFSRYQDWHYDVKTVVGPFDHYDGNAYSGDTDPLTHWGRVTHICVSELTITGSDNGLSPRRRQAIIWNKAGLLLIEPLIRNKLQWNFNRNSNISIQKNALEHVVCEMVSILSRPHMLRQHFMGDHYAPFWQLQVQPDIMLERLERWVG